MHRIVAMPLFYRGQNVLSAALHSLLQRSGLYCAETHRQNAKNFVYFSAIQRNTRLLHGSEKYFQKILPLHSPDRPHQITRADTYAQGRRVVRRLAARSSGGALGCE